MLCKSVVGYCKSSFRGNYEISHTLPLVERLMKSSFKWSLLNFDIVKSSVFIIVNNTGEKHMRVGIYNLRFNNTKRM